MLNPRRERKTHKWSIEEYFGPEVSMAAVGSKQSSEGLTEGTRSGGLLVEQCGDRANGLGLFLSVNLCKAWLSESTVHGGTSETSARAYA